MTCSSFSEFHVNRNQKFKVLAAYGNPNQNDRAKLSFCIECLSTVDHFYYPSSDFATIASQVTYLNQKIISFKSEYDSDSVFFNEKSTLFQVFIVCHATKLQFLFQLPTHPCSSTETVPVVVMAPLTIIRKHNYLCRCMYNIHAIT